MLLTPDPARDTSALVISWPRTLLPFYTTVMGTCTSIDPNLEEIPSSVLADRAQNLGSTTDIVD